MRNWDGSIFRLYNFYRFSGEDLTDLRVFRPYLQCCRWENPRGLRQLMLRLYFADHLRFVVRNILL